MKDLLRFIVGALLTFAWLGGHAQMLDKKALSLEAARQVVTAAEVEARKNGWKPLPTCTAAPAQCPWQVNSTGWVRGQGRDYVITVLTTQNPAGPGVAPTVAEEDSPGFLYGIGTVQGVSQIVWQNLG